MESRLSRNTHLKGFIRKATKFEEFKLIKSENTSAISKKTKNQEKVSFYGKMVRNTVDNGKTAKSMEKEHGRHQMATCIMDNGFKGRSKVMESINRQMVIIFVKIRSIV